MHDVAVAWFRRDLRLEDNPAWAAATAEARAVVALVVLDDALLASSPRRAGFYVASLRALDEELRRLGGSLRAVRGDPTVLVPRLAAELGAGAVHVNADVTPYAQRRDAAVAAALGERSLRSWWGGLVHEPGAVRTVAGGLSQVFTPFHRRWAATEPTPWPEPGDATVLDAADGPLPDDDGAWRAALPVGGSGSAGAHERLAAFLEVVDRYHDDRDRPDRDGTSHLGVDLRFGTISPRHVRAVVGDHTEGRAALVRQLAWRDWWAHLLASRPDLVDHAQRPELDAIAWEDDDEGFAAWCEGRTGYPIVDAAQRELVATGWLHNRLRMISASFLVKDLLVDWRRGERFFRRHLLDGDVPQNVGSWQWVAGTGPDAAPWFRLLNPVVQARRHDPAGTHVVRWVPEVEGLVGPLRHAPWEAGPLELAAAGIVLGETYPAPIVDHAAARERTLAAYRAARGA